MQPQRQPLRAHRDRFHIPDFTFPSSPTTRPNAIPVFNFPRNVLNLNSRPFTITNHTRRTPTFQAYTSRTTTMRPTVSTNNLPNPSLKHTQIECRYCSNSFEPEVMAEHVNSCDMSKMTCDKCGDRVLVDFYEMHLEECGLQVSGDSHPVLNTRHGDSMEEDDDDDSMDIDMDLDEIRERTPPFFMADSEMTYERLLMLDEGIQKKGMTAKEMKEFQVQLYVKSLDGEGSCVICISDYETGEYVRKLSCKHKFHKGCIDKWLDCNITCPTCKKYLR